MFNTNQPVIMKNTKYTFPIIKKIDSSDANRKVETYIVGSENRDNNQFGEIDLADAEKYYQFIYDDETTWFTDSKTTRELFTNSKVSNRDGEVYNELSLYLHQSDGDRSAVGRIALKVINVFTKPLIDTGVKIIAEKLENQHLNNLEGLNQLSKTFELIPFNEKKIDVSAPLLLFIHGTNSDTQGAFSGLTTNDSYSKMYDMYGSNIIAFQHRTLTQSPLKNAVQLANSLPNNSTLHIISHSRGGLVGDILCKYATNNGNSNKGFLREQIELLSKEKRTDDIEYIQQLAELFKTKNIRIDKFIRVASPSAGTILASERLDHIFNVFFNLIGDKANVIAALTHDLIEAVLKEKHNINVLPGIEAMDPESPFIKVLNYNDKAAEIDGNSLMVISGNGKVSASFHGVLVILGKLFYWRRNDLVVNTDSMYLGVKRNSDIQYFFDEGTTVDHVHYFDNKKTQDALLNALKNEQGQQIIGFKNAAQLSIPASDRGILSLDGGQLFPNTNVPSGKKPIVVLLPGIMGSNIYDENERLWLNYWKIVKGGLSDMSDLSNPNHAAKSVIKSSYERLNSYLSSAYDVVIFPFDWRKPMEENAKLLNKTITYLIGLEQPIKIIGHSMGGVLIRDFIAYHPTTWQKLNAIKTFKLLFLGTPLRGSHRILTVLFGKDSIIKKLSFIDMKHSKKELVDLFTQLPGILALLPFTDSQDDDYADKKTWEAMRNAFDSKWSIPSDANLELFRKYRDKINLLIKNDKIDFSKAYYIAGYDKATPNKHLIEDNSLVFEYTNEGDQSVTWELGIPKKLIEKNQVYYSDVTHGELANEPKLFAAIEEILIKGSTSKLSQTKPTFREGQKSFRYVEEHDFDFSEQGLENSILGLKVDNEIIPSLNPISISVSHGDLVYATFPMLAGHFKNDAILYAEATIDYNSNFVLTHKHQLGAYPGDIGTYEIIGKQGVFFEGALIVGLGEPGKLTSFTLTKTVELAISNYLLSKSNSKEITKNIGISSLLIASGYGGLTIENSIKAIIEGINNANKNSIRINQNSDYCVEQIEFIELYESNASNCLFALKKIEAYENDIYNIHIESNAIKKLFGSRKKMSIESAEEWWNRITVEAKKEDELTPKRLVFTVSTGDAHESQNEIFTNTALIDVLISKISTENQWSEKIAKTLFELLIPNGFKENLKRKGNISWLVDKDSASYPWELLQDNSIKAKPLCIDSGMVRQLIINNNPNQIERILENKILIISDPNTEGFVSQLPGAREEGELVRKMFTEQGYACNPQEFQTAPEILIEFFSQAYKIIHLAGHGYYNSKQPKSSGMIIGKNSFLTTSEINQLSTIPEFVFVNCCHLGKINIDEEENYQNRFKLSANIGTELIEKGVKAVIVAAWQVSDNDAKKFARIFYENMFRGESFGNAVKFARASIYDKNRSNNTWGAYQCYGDPYYKFTNRQRNGSAASKKYIIEEQAYIDLFNLHNKLDIRNNTKERMLNQLHEILDGISASGLDSARIVETSAYIYYELGMYDEAYLKLVALKSREDGDFTVNALEKFCNTICYKCYQDYNSKKITSAQAKKKLNDTLKDLKKLLEITKTAERLSLIASTHKRLGYVYSSSTESKLKHYSKASDYYKESYDINSKTYPLNNYLIFKTIIDFQTKSTPTRKSEYQKHTDNLNGRKKNLKNSSLNMDYWETADYTGIGLTLLFLNADKANENENWDKLAAHYKETRSKYGSYGKKLAELYNLELIVDALNCVQIDDEHLEILKAKVPFLIQELKSDV